MECWTCIHLLNDRQEHLFFGCSFFTGLGQDTDELVIVEDDIVLYGFVVHDRDYLRIFEFRSSLTSMFRMRAISNNCSTDG